MPVSSYLRGTNPPPPPHFLRQPVFLSPASLPLSYSSPSGVKEFEPTCHLRTGARWGMEMIVLAALLSGFTLNHEKAKPRG